MSSEIIVLENARSRAVILPRAGGRIISFEAASREWLWSNPDLLSPEWTFLEDPSLAQQATDLGTWKNWGGDKSWPAPQGWSSRDEWAGPPDPVLDSGGYSAQVVREGSECLLTSQGDARTGLQIQRRITMNEGSAGLRVDTTMTNISEEPRTWACWTVTQVNTSVSNGESHAWVEVGQFEDAEPVVLFEALGKPTASRIDEETLRVPVENVVGKLGFPGASGSISVHFPGGEYLLQQFEVDYAGHYPDNGSRAELWMQFPTERPIESLDGLSLTGKLVEIECLGPLAELLPGQSTSLSVDWSVLTRQD